MGKAFRIRWAGALSAMAVVLCHEAPALAQKPASVARPEGINFLPWIIALGVIFVVGFTAFLNPKRSHLA